MVTLQMLRILRTHTFSPIPRYRRQICFSRQLQMIDRRLFLSWKQFVLRVLFTAAFSQGSKERLGKGRTNGDGMREGARKRSRNSFNIVMHLRMGIVEQWKIAFSPFSNITSRKPSVIALCASYPFTVRFLYPFLLFLSRRSPPTEFIFRSSLGKTFRLMVADHRQLVPCFVSVP